MAEFTQKVLFEFGGGREMVSEDKARALLEGVGNITDPNHIRLSNKSFSSEAAAVVAGRLATFKNIEIADISDIIAGRPEDDALRTLKIICESIDPNKLVELNVSDNALGAKGVTSCRSLFVCKTLERLYVCNNGLSAEAAELIGQLLQEDGVPPLKLLHFYNNMSGNGGAIAIANLVKLCPQIEDFRFSATRSMNEGCIAVAKSLSSIPNLRRLDLSDNNFGDEAAESLAVSLRVQTHLEYLNLRDAGLGEDGIASVIDALKESAAQLKFLDLSGNDITTDQAVQLSSLLQTESLRNLSELSLDDNDLTSDGAKAISKGLRSLKHLKALSVCTCEIGSGGAYVIASEVSKLRSFVTLKIDGNQISSRAVDEITSVLENASKVLTEMDDNDDDADDEDLDDLIAQAEEAAAAAGGAGEEEEEELLVAAMKATAISDGAR